jgi:hypothetical protein
LAHANGLSGQCEADIQTILDESVEGGTRRLWVSSVLFAELRPSSFVPGKFKSLEELARYIRSLAHVVTPDPITMLRVARLRDLKWEREKPVKGEKPKCMSLGDAIHIASALWVKEVDKVSDLEFLTFDDGRSNSSELDHGTKSLSILRLENYTHGIGSNADVSAAVSLWRTKPVLPQHPLPFPADSREKA